MQKEVFPAALLFNRPPKKMEPFWEPNGCPPHTVKYESDTAVSGYPYCSENGLNFSASGAAYSEDDADFTPGRRGKVSRQDPLSHRIIEKRRRDRMNSCLADLSRLIPPQYQRKGRGRIEKTEIIEMSIRYMKQLQNQEYMHKESAYKLGFEECMQQAANFLYNGHREVCFQLVNHLREHSNDIMKGEYVKIRHTVGSRSVSSGSPPIHNYHPAAPLNQLRDMLSTSDLEHSNSPDHNDVKDLSLRSQPHQAAVITSTAPTTHLDTTNHSHEFDSRRPSPNLDNGHTHSSVLRNIRKMSDGFHDSDHSHYSYKFKNYFKERFSQDSHMDETMNNESGSKSPTEEQLISINKKPKMSIDYSDNNSCDEKPSTNGITEFKPEVSTGTFPLFSKSPTSNGTNKTVPIFALHTQGRYYVPLSVEYDCLLPYLGDVDLFEKSTSPLPPPLHAININVNFASPRKTPFSSQSKMKADSLSNGW